jgi:flagellar motility protein MotE (MotC chaperone)
MRAGFFSPLLIILILALTAKASMLFGRIQEQTTYASDANASSVLVDTAYAKTSEGDSDKKASSGNTTASSEPKKREATIKSHEAAEQVENIAPVKEDQKNSKNSNSMINSNNFTKSELELLKELSKRREKLEGEKKELSNREQILRATENKLDQKVEELKKLQSQLEDLMKEYDQKEQGKIMSLVKIYETMKPKDAAKIFNELEMPVLLKVVSNMKEVKVAPIIASMNPEKAKELSMEIAKQKPLN